MKAYHLNGKGNGTREKISFKWNIYIGLICKHRTRVGEAFNIRRERVLVNIRRDKGSCGCY